jgi:hypothetical protein
MPMRPGSALTDRLNAFDKSFRVRLPTRGCLTPPSRPVSGPHFPLKREAINRTEAQPVVPSRERVDLPDKLASQGEP